MPDVIELRRRLHPESHDCTLIGSSVTYPDWLTEISKDRSTIIIAEGLLEYLTAEEVKTLLNRLTDHFLHGQIVFDGKAT